MSVLIDNRQDIIAVLEHGSYEEDYEISISFVNNEEMRSLNERYRGIDKETDVLSFPLAEFFEGDFEEEDGDTEYIEEEIVLGDIVISTEMALKQSKEYGHSVKRELAFLLVHGMLHLLGYDHKDEASEKEMFDIQEEILGELKDM